MSFTLSRSPAVWKASMVVFMDVIVTVSSAESATRVAFLVAGASMNSSGAPPPPRWVARRRQQRPDDLHGRLHGPRREQHLGHEVLFALEAPAHLVHGWHETSAHNRERRYPCRDGGLGHRGRGLPVSLDHGFVQLFQIGHAHLR